MEFHCTQCWYSSKYKSNLKKHFTTHSKYFKCNKCEFQAITKRFLQNHMIDHEWKDNEFEEYLSNPITVPSNLTFSFNIN